MFESLSLLYFNFLKIGTKITPLPVSIELSALWYSDYFLLTLVSAYSGTLTSDGSVGYHHSSNIKHLCICILLYTLITLSLSPVMGMEYFQHS